MKVIKNAQISKMYGVSRPTVGKWVESALEKENNLQLHKNGNRYFVLDNDYNHAELNKLKEKGLKYRNKIGYELVKPIKEFYETFSESQLIELITNLQNNSYIPTKFSYCGEGAKKWENYIQAGLANAKDFYLKEDIALVEACLDYVVMRLKSYKEINIVDVGPGNGLGSKPVIDRLKSEGFKVKYVGIDISRPMLDILENNIKNWYQDLNYELKLGDLDYMIIRDRLFANKLGTKDASANLILFNNTIGNVPDRIRVLKNLHDSMGKDDFLWVNNGLESPAEFQSFEDTMTYFSEVYKWIPKKLGLDESMYSLEKRYDPKTRVRTEVLKLNKDIDIEFDFEGYTKTVSFLQDDEIVVWSYFTYKLDQFINEIRDIGFFITNLACHPDKRDAIIMCELPPSS